MSDEINQLERFENVLEIDINNLFVKSCRIEDDNCTFIKSMIGHYSFLHDNLSIITSYLNVRKISSHNKDIHEKLKNTIILYAEVGNK